VFSWKIGGQKVVAVLDYDAIKSLLKVGDGKVGGLRGGAGYLVGGEGVVAVLDYDAIKSLLKVGDSKVGGVRK
jgi:hypothetical protein